MVETTLTRFTPSLQGFNQHPEVAIARKQHKVIDRRCEFHRVHRQFDFDVALDLSASGRVCKLPCRLGHNGKNHYSPASRSAAVLRNIPDPQSTRYNNRHAVDIRVSGRNSSAVYSRFQKPGLWKLRTDLLQSIKRTIFSRSSNIWTSRKAA